MITLTRLLSEVALQNTLVKMPQILLMLSMGLTIHKDIPSGTSLGLISTLFSQFYAEKSK